MDLLYIRGALPLTASVIFILVCAYVGIHKVRRIILYNIGVSSTLQRNMPIRKAAKLFNKRMMQDKLSGIGHLFIMIGFILFMIGFFVNLIQVISYTLGQVIFLEGAILNSITLSLNLGSIMLCMGTLMGLVRRLSGKGDRLTKSMRHMMPLIIMLVASLAGMVYEGMKSLVYASEPIYSFIGRLVIYPIKSLLINSHGLHVCYEISWYILLITTGIMMFSLIKGKMPHMAASMLNLMNVEVEANIITNHTEKLVSKLLEDDSEFDEDTVFGIKYINNLNDKQLTQLDACAECGRCDSVCPAYQSNKKLSPQKLLLSNRKYLDSYDVTQPKDMSISMDVKEMIWECNTCDACQQACPSSIKHSDIILDIRRNFIMNSGETISEFNKVIDNVNKRQNPFGLDDKIRGKLIEACGIPYYKKNVKYDYVLWLGCHAYFDDRMKNVIRSLVNILKKAGKTFAVMQDETCCGETVRKMGDEFKFQEIVHKNKEKFANYNIDNILTLCPHCYDVFKSQYPPLGCNVNVMHYLEILENLIEKVHTSNTEVEKKRIVYHDACLLGRRYHMYDQPRKILDYINNTYEQVSIGIEKENSICCGGGGGRIWADEKIENRPSFITLEALKDKEVDIMVTSCPYCLSIFDDMKNTIDPAIEVMDLMELVD